VATGVRRTAQPSRVERWEAETDMEAVLAVLGAIGLLIAIAANLTRVAEFLGTRRQTRRLGRAPESVPRRLADESHDRVAPADAAARPGTPAIRAPGERIRVFVSAAVHEMAAERAAARRAIEALRLTPVLLELGARPHAPSDLYRAYLEQSDVFVGIYGERYGWVAPGDVMSGLEDEYRRVGERPRLLYVRHALGPREPRLEALLARVREDGPATYRAFGDAGELEDLLAGDLATLMSERFERPPTAGAAGFAAPPTAPGPLIDREAELAHASDLILEHGARLVTIVGPGGIGKSRLALAVFERLAADRRGRAWPVAYADLQELGEVHRVPSAIAAALGLISQDERAAAQAVKAFLAPLELLLVLDNFEQVVEAAAVIADLLASAPGLTAIVTSRVPLRLSAERAVPLAPLPIPHRDDAAPAELVRRARTDPGVQLFLWLASARTELVIDERTAPVLLDIARRLEGWPLAILLAAARVDHMSLEQLRDRLGRGLDLLVGGGRDLPDRQRTLRGTIQWSLDLLGADAKRLLTWLGAFAGGATLETIERLAELVRPPLGAAAIDALAELVDHSLVVHHAEALPRYTSLEMIRAAAAEMLAASPESEQVLRAHAQVFVELAAREGPALFYGHSQAHVALSGQEGNLRVALGRLLERDDVTSLAELAASLWQYWGGSGQQREQLVWIDRLLARDGLEPRDRVRLVLAGAAMHLQLGASERGAQLLAEAEQLRPHLPDPRAEVALPLGHSFVAASRGDLPAAAAAAATARGLAQAAGSAWADSMASMMLARVALAQRRLADALACARDAIEALAVDRGSQGWARMSVAVIQALADDHEPAQASVAEALATFSAIGYHQGIPTALETAAFVAARAAQDDRAVRLAAAAERAKAMLGASASEPEASIVAAELEALRRRSGSAWQELWDEGQRMPLDVAVRYGIASGPGKHLSAAAQQRAAAAP
jgi:predicted ATPase